MTKEQKDLIFGFAAIGATPQSIARVLDIPVEEVLKHQKSIRVRKVERLEKVQNVV
jgi:hypothetical protein